MGDGLRENSELNELLCWANFTHPEPRQGCVRRDGPDCRHHGPMTPRKTFQRLGTAWPRVWCKTVFHTDYCRLQ